MWTYNFSCDSPTGDKSDDKGTNTIASIERHLSNADRTRRSEEQGYRGRTPVNRSPPPARRLSPLKNQGSPRKTRRDARPAPPGPRPVDHDDPGVWRHGGLKKCPSDPTRYSGPGPSQIPVTVLGLDLDDNMQEVRMKKLSQGSLGGRKIHTRHHSEPYAPSPCLADVGGLSEDSYLKGVLTSKSSYQLPGEDIEDPAPPPMSSSPPRLTPLRTPSASDKSRGVRIPHTIDEGAIAASQHRQYILDLDRMQLTNHSQSPIQLSGAMYMYPNSRKVLPPTPTYLTECPPEDSDLQLLGNSQDIGSKENSPRYNPAEDADSTSRLQVGDLTRGRSVLRDGCFNIEESRVRTTFNVDDSRVRSSNDSGLPDDKASSKSSSVSSSVSNLSSGSPGPPDNHVFADNAVATGGAGGGQKAMKKSQSDSNLAGKKDTKVLKAGNRLSIGTLPEESAGDKQDRSENSDAKNSGVKVASGGAKEMNAQKFNNKGDMEKSDKGSNNVPNAKSSGLHTKVTATLNSAYNKDSKKDSSVASMSKNKLYSGYKDTGAPGANTNIEKGVKSFSDTKIVTKTPLSNPVTSSSSHTTTVTHIQLNAKISETTTTVSTSPSQTMAKSVPATTSFTNSVTESRTTAKQSGVGKSSTPIVASTSSSSVTVTKSTTMTTSKPAPSGKVRPPVPARPSATVATPRVSASQTPGNHSNKDSRPVKSQQDSLLKSSVSVKSNNGKSTPSTVTNASKPQTVVTAANKTDKKLVSRSVSVESNISQAVSSRVAPSNSFINKPTPSSQMPSTSVKSTTQSPSSKSTPTKPTSQSSASSKPGTKVIKASTPVRATSNRPASPMGGKVTPANSSASNTSRNQTVTSEPSTATEKPKADKPVLKSSGNSDGRPKVEQVDIPVVTKSSQKQQETADSAGVSASLPASKTLKSVSSTGQLQSMGQEENTNMLPPVTAPAQGSKGDGQASKPGSASSTASRQTVKCIQVKPYEGPEGSKPPGDYSGPVITNPFESLTRQREQALLEQGQDSSRGKDKVVPKIKQSLYPKKAGTKTPDARVTSATKRMKKPPKTASDEASSRPQRPRSKKAKSKKKKKKPGDKEDLMLTDRPDGDPSGSAFISGKGWYIRTDCDDSADVQAVKLHDDSSSSDSDDDTTYVQPNYLEDFSDDSEDEVTTRTVLPKLDSVRRSLERDSLIPGQVAGGDSDQDADSEDFGEAEEVQVEVAFAIGSESDSSPAVTERGAASKDEGSVFKSAPKIKGSMDSGLKPKLKAVQVKGTEKEGMDRSSPGIVLQVDKAIEEFSRGVSAQDLNEMLDGDDTNIEAEPKASVDNRKTPVEVQKSSATSSRQESSAKEKTKSHPDEDSEIDDMIDEIFKSTPNPSLTLSWKSRSESDSQKKGVSSVTKEILQRHLNHSQMRSVTRETLQRHLDQSQIRSFKELPNLSNSDSDRTPESKSLDDSDPEELESLNKLANAYKQLPLKVPDTTNSSPPEPPSEKSTATSSAAVKGKPPVPPKPTVSIQNTTTVVAMKSPRFVRKINSLRGHAAFPVKEADAVSMASDFGTASLPGMDGQDSFVPEDRAETVTSRLGRHHMTSQAGSEDTCYSDVQTIQWKRGNLLGKGAYGKVWCGLTNAGELIAVKQIQLNMANFEKAEKEYEKIQEEVDLLKTLRHENIVGYLGTSLEDEMVSIFMQFVPGGSIYNLISRFGALEEEVFCRYTLQILEGVQYLHKNNVIHRDIKGGNIMLMPNGVIKLIDFGCAKRLYLNMSPSMNSSGQKHLLKSMRGTPYWMAPEVVREEGHGTKSDIWSIGCTVFEMATMKPPWSDVTPYAAIFAIGNNEKPVPKLPEKFSPEARNFVLACLTRNQHHRPSAADLLSHAFIAKIKRRSFGGIS